ncbi:MAG: hypothetical protein ACREBR_05690 [bacterium]
MIIIQRNTDGSLKTNRTSHTADLVCDCCRTLASCVDMNVNAEYSSNLSGSHVCITLKCSVIGGSCTSITCWPLSNGTVDAIELALVKTV